MNGKMYEHPVTQENIKLLRDQGVQFVDPVIGELACGYEGMGKLAPIDDILAAAKKILSG